MCGMIAQWVMLLPYSARVLGLSLGEFDFIPLNINDQIMLAVEYNLC